GVMAIAAAGPHALALKSDGTVVAWGWLSYVPSGLSGVKAIAAGGLFNLALKNDGTVVAWGDDSHGETDVPAGLSGVKLIAAGGRFAVALKNDGTMVAWGDNTYGQTNIPAGLSGVTALAAGFDFTVAIVSGGTPPAIAAQPQSTVANAASDITMTVTATGPAPLTYQWRKDGVNIPGATAASLTLHNVQGANAGSYDVVV